MISCMPAGRLGNVMFEVSAVVAYSLRHNMDYCIPNHNYDYFRFFKKVIVCNTRPPNAVIYTEPSHGFNEIPYFENVILSGYFQSEKYFADYKEQILELFGFKYSIKNGWVGIHNRLGDYKQYADRHHNITDEYIGKAIQYFNLLGYFNFLVFSDGMDETKQRVNDIVYPSCTFAYSENRNEFDDMELMANCEHQIISASTFSLWSYILNSNPNKICVAPKIWFCGQNAHLETKDLYPENCIKL